MFQFFYALTTLFSWGTEIVFVKKALNRVKIFNALSIRYFFAAVLLVLLVLFLGGFRFPSAGILPYFLFTNLIGAAAIIFFYKAVSQGGATISTAIAKNHFLITTAIAVLFLSESISLAQLGAMGLILCALVILSFDNKKEGLVLGKGTVYSLLTLVGWGAYFAMIKPIVMELGAVNGALFNEGTIFLMILIYALITRKEFKFNDFKANKLLAADALFATIGIIAYNYSIQAIGASLTAIAVAPIPIITSIFAALFLKERLSRTKYLAILVSVSGLVLLFI